MSSWRMSRGGAGNLRNIVVIEGEKCQGMSVRVKTKFQVHRESTLAT